MARTCVFLGPSLSGWSPGGEIGLLPPAMRGSIAAAIRAGYTRIGIVDGALGADAVPPQEIRKALRDPAIEIFGGASMGAVRAAQLHARGMQGIGRVYRLLRRSVVTDPEEVYVLHAPAALRYRPLTLPLVNVRYTLRAMRRAGHMTRDEERSTLARLAEVPWFDRDRQSLSAALSDACSPGRSARLCRCFDALYRDVKRDDALLLLATLQARRAGHPPDHERAERKRTWRKKK